MSAIHDFIEEKIIVSNKPGEGKKIIVVRQDYQLKTVKQAVLTQKEYNEIVRFLTNYFK